MLRELWERLKPHIGLILAGVASAGIAYYLFTRPASKNSGTPSTVTFPATGGGSGGGGSSGGSTAPTGPTTPMEWLTQTFANLIAAPPSTGLPSYATSGNLNELLNYMAGRTQYVSADAVSLWNWLVKIGGAPPGGFLPPSSGPPVVTPSTPLVDPNSLAAINQTQTDIINELNRLHDTGDTTSPYFNALLSRLNFVNNQVASLGGQAKTAGQWLIDIVNNAGFHGPPPGGSSSQSIDINSLAAITKTGQDVAAELQRITANGGTTTGGYIQGLTDRLGFINNQIVQMGGRPLPSPLRNVEACGGVPLLPGQTCVNGIPTWTRINQSNNTNANQMTNNQLANLVKGR